MEKLKKCVIALSIHGVSETCFSHTVKKQIAGNMKSINMKNCESPSAKRQCDTKSEKLPTFHHTTSTFFSFCNIS
jgi:hypothetical protein